MIRVHIVYLNECGEDCPDYEDNNGGGHMDAFKMCHRTKKEISGWGVNGFPEFCPLTITKAEYDK